MGTDDLMVLREMLNKRGIAFTLGNQTVTIPPVHKHYVKDGYWKSEEIEPERNYRQIVLTIATLDTLDCGCTTVFNFTEDGGLINISSKKIQRS